MLRAGHGALLAPQRDPGQEPAMRSPTEAAMTLAFAEARAAAARGEVPVGAVVLAPDGAVLASAGNATEANCDAAGHAELLALRLAGQRLATPRLPGCDLVVTLEPCPMCAAAISLFRIRRLTFAAYDPKGGGVEHGARIYQAATCLHRPEVIGGVREREAATLLRAFFESRR
jgi:cytosine deaminase